MKSYHLDTEAECIEIASQLSEVDDYLACEQVVIRNIKRIIDNGATDEKINEFLEKFNSYLQLKILASQGNFNCTRYRYASAFIGTLLQMPYWKGWIKNSNT